MFMREMKSEFVLIIFDGLQRREFDIGVPGEPSGVEAPRVVTGLTMHDLLGQQPTVPAAFAQPGT